MKCTSGKVRLAGGPNENIGRVERCMNNQWKAVCADQWGEDEATVVCRQLKFRVDGQFLCHSLYMGLAAILPHFTEVCLAN